MTITRALETPGFMAELELSYLAELASRSNLIVEIGTWRGRSARALADNTPGKLFCVDTWADNAYGAVFPEDASDLCQHKDWLWNEFNKNLGDVMICKVTPYRMQSVEAAALLGSTQFDMIFIDAGHNYEDVVADINAWRPLLREGGVLCGHDYADYHPGVVRAVDELVPRFRVVGTIWTTDLGENG